MNFLEDASSEEKKGLLLLYLGRQSENDGYIEYCDDTPELSDSYNLLVSEGYLKIIGSRLSGDLNVNNVALTEKGVNACSELENKLLYINDFWNGM